MKYTTIKFPLCLTLTLAVSILAYSFLTSTSSGWANDYYARLGKAFMAGHTYLESQPSPALLALPNPYDPATRNGKIGRIEDQSAYNSKMGFLWDTSLYQGKYYLYFGPVPALIPWMPLTWLADVSLTDQAMVLIYCIFGSASLLLLLHWVTQHASAATNVSVRSELIWLLAALPICFGTAIPALLRRAMFYEAAIAGAYCYAAIGITCLWYAYAKHPRNPTLWKLLASLCLGLAAGCRLFHGANIFILLAVWLYVCKGKSPGHAIKEGVALLAPWLLVMSCIATYNYLRFDSIFETGVSYQLGLSDNRVPGAIFGSFGNFLSNAGAYLFSLHPASNLIPWDKHFGRADIIQSFGLITHSSFIVWGLFTVSLIRRGGLLSHLTLGICAYALCCFVVVAFFNWNIARYMADFSPWLMLVAAICFIHMATRRKTILVLGAITSAWTVYSGFFAFSCITCF